MEVRAGRRRPAVLALVVVVVWLRLKMLPPGLLLLPPQLCRLMENWWLWIDN